MTKEEKEAAKAAEKEAKDAAKAAETSEDIGNFRVFYKELTASGERNGDNAFKDFTSRAEATAFADEVGGKLAK